MANVKKSAEQWDRIFYRFASNRETKFPPGEHPKDKRERDIVKRILECDCHRPGVRLVFGRFKRMLDGKVMSCSCSYHVPEKARSSAPSMFQVVDQSSQISLPSTPLQVVMSSCHHEDAQASPADSFNVNERANKQVRILTLRAIQTFILYLWIIIL